MATLRRIEIHRFRNVEPGTVIELNPGINVLLGRNGSGKTTLLQWLADILSGKTSRWEDEPYDVALEFHGEQARTTIRTKNNPSTMRARLPRIMKQGGRALVDERIHRDMDAGLEVDAHIETSEGQYVFRMDSSEMSIGWPNQEQPIVLHSPAERNMGLAAMLTFALVIGPMFDFPKSESLDQFCEDYRGASESLCRFDESLELFSTIIGQQGANGSASLLQLVSHGGYVGFVDRDHGLIPNDLAELIKSRVMESTQKNAIPTTFSFSHTSVPFLHKAVALFEYSSATIEIALLEKRVLDKGAELYDLGDIRFTFVRPDGSIISHAQLSFGQKRMLAFLYYVAANPSIVIVDEMVNGLHHAWIDACIEEIGDRQALLTSQNPLLLDYLSFESPDEVRTRFVLCRSERQDGKERLIWRNPTMEEAESFFSAYEAGIQHVGEILMDKGLW